MGRWFTYGRAIEYFSTPEPNALEILLQKERKQRLAAMWQEWMKAPWELREKVLNGGDLGQTERILWVGLKRRLMKKLK